MSSSRNKKSAVGTVRSKGTSSEKTKAPARPKQAKALAKGVKSIKADDARGDRSKRLLDLVMLLLRARTPVTYREIREQFAGYQTNNAEAGLRAFERDKADLLDLGVPIRYITPEEDDSLEDGGYVIDLKRFRMPEVRLTADEVSALVLAASVARAMPGGAYPKIVDLALKKLAFDLPELPDTPTEFPRPAGLNTSPNPVLVHFPEQRPIGVAKEIGENFATAESAIRFRKKVSFTYQAAGTGTVSRREVDPYGLVYRDAAWVLVGWCHLRKEVRSFRVDRMRGVEMAPKPKSPDFERPAGLDVRDYASRSPWTFATEPPEDVELEIRPEAADTGNDDFGASAVKKTEGEKMIVRFPCTNVDFAVSKILAAKGAIQVRRGERLRKRLAEELQALAARYA